MAAKFAVTGDQYMVIDRRMKEIKRQLRQEGGSPLDTELVARALQDIVEGRFSVPHTYPVTVDYGMTLGDMVAAGGYDAKNDYITQENFPITGAGMVEVEFHLVHLNRYASTDAALVELNRQGFRPAKIEELLAFGARYKNLQKEFPIVALGSVWQSRSGDRLVANLDYWDGERNLVLGWVGYVWHEPYRFLAVRK